MYYTLPQYFSKHVFSIRVEKLWILESVIEWVGGGCSERTSSLPPEFKYPMKMKQFGL